MSKIVDRTNLWIQIIPHAIIYPHDQRHHDWHHSRPHYRNQDWPRSRQHGWPKLWCQCTFIWIYPIHHMRDIILLFHLLQNIARIAKKYIELDIMKLWSQLEERNSGSPLTQSSTQVSQACLNSTPAGGRILTKPIFKFQFINILQKSLIAQIKFYCKPIFPCCNCYNTVVISPAKQFLCSPLLQRKIGDSFFVFCK